MTSLEIQFATAGMAFGISLVLAATAIVSFLVRETLKEEGTSIEPNTFERVLLKASAIPIGVGTIAAIKAVIEWIWG